MSMSPSGPSVLTFALIPYVMYLLYLYSIVYEEWIKEKKILYHFPALIYIKVLRGHYIWYQSKKVKTLGPDGLIDMQVCCELCDLTM